jgi:hypothetical protein
MIIFWFIEIANNLQSLVGSALGIIRPGTVQKDNAFYLIKNKKKVIEKILYTKFVLQNY